MSVVTLRWVEDRLMVGTDSNGHSIAIGKQPGKSDEFAGMKASDLLLLSVAACAAYDVIGILIKGRETFQALKVTCTGEQKPEPPFSFTSISLQYEVTGPVKKDRMERAVRLVEEKYCSVISTLRSGVPILCEYVIHHPDRNAAIEQH